MTLLHISISKCIYVESWAEVWLDSSMYLSMHFPWLEWIHNMHVCLNTTVYIHIRMHMCAKICVRVECCFILPNRPLNDPYLSTVNNTIPPNNNAQFEIHFNISLAHLPLNPSQVGSDPVGLEWPFAEQGLSVIWRMSAWQMQLRHTHLHPLC